jgi:hypothetical protein
MGPLVTISSAGVILGAAAELRNLWATGHIVVVVVVADNEGARQLPSRDGAKHVRGPDWGDSAPCPSSPCTPRPTLSRLPQHGGGRLHVVHGLGERR